MTKKKKSKNRNVRKSISKKRSKKQSNLSIVISHAKNAFQARTRYFSKLSAYEVRSNVKKVASHPFFQSAINLTLNSNLRLAYRQPAPDTDLITSLNWVIGLIIHHKEILNRFAELETLLTFSILNDDLDKAILILDEIDSICGISTWSIANRGSILRIADKFEQAQEFLNKIFMESADNNFFKAICRSMMDRYSESSMFISSNTALRKQIIRTIQGGFQSFLIYKIVPLDFSINYKINYEDVFNYEKKASIIDIFKAVMNFMTSTIDAESPELVDAAKLTADLLLPHFSYSILDGLSAVYGVVPSKWHFDKSDYDLIDSYSAGNYADVCDKAKQTKNQYFSFATFELIARSAVRTGGGPFDGIKQKILSDIIELLLKRDGYDKSLSNLLSICHAFSGIPWFQELHFLLARESSFIDEKSYENLMVLSSAYSQVNFPRNSLALHREHRNEYLKACNDAIKNSLSIKLFEIINDENVEFFDDKILYNLEFNRRQKYKAKILIKKGLIDEAIPILEELSYSDDQIVAYEAMKLLIESYININDCEKAIELFGKSALKNNNIVFGINTNKICEVAKSLVNTSSSIYVPISLSLHSRFVDSRFDSALRYSFEKFLPEFCTMNQN